MERNNITEKHGLSQYRLNSAKDHAQEFVEVINKIELMFQLSAQDMVDERVAEEYITSNIKEIEQNWEYFKSYIEQRKRE